MKPVWKWILGVVVVVLVLAAIVGTPFLYRAVYGDTWVGMGGHMRFPGGHWDFPFFSFGMFFLPLFRLGWLVLIGLAIYWLVRSLKRPAGASRVCTSCQKPLQADWTYCPHCGAKV
jgi:hypothetical protein